MSRDCPPLPPEKTPLVVDYLQLLLEKAHLEKQIEAQHYVLQRMSDVLLEFGVAVGANNAEECMRSLRKWLSDANTLYAMMRGECKASQLLADIERIVPAEIFGAIVVDLSAFLAPRLQKFVEQLTDAGPEHQAAITAAMLLTGLKGWEAHRPIFERRILTIQQLQRKLAELCEAAGINDPAERTNLETEISQVIGADGFALAQLESGDFSEVERLFCERTRRDRISVQ